MNESQWKRNTLRELWGLFAAARIELDDLTGLKYSPSRMAEQYLDDRMKHILEIPGGRKGSNKENDCLIRLMVAKRAIDFVESIEVPEEPTEEPEYTHDPNRRKLGTYSLANAIEDLKQKEQSK